MTVGYIYCYKQLDYIRSRTLISMIEHSEDLMLVSARNTTKNTLRYLQTLLRLIDMRIRYRPEVYILAFRGFEIYWPVRILTLGKPLVFDEFINLHDWVVYEHKKVKRGGVVAKLIKLYMRGVIKTSQVVLSDTELHAKNSSDTYGTDISKYATIYMAADEKLFTPVNVPRKANAGFNVFFYGTFLPLHGMSVLLKAAEKLSNKPINFTIIGGAGRRRDMHDFKKYLDEHKLVNVIHKPWVDFEELPGCIAASDVCLGGPFGNTPQANKVITGKTFQFLAMSKLTVVGQTDELAEFVDRENCLLVQQGNPDELANVIMWAYEHQDQIDNIAKSGYDLYISKFSTKAQSHKIINIIKEAAN